MHRLAIFASGSGTNAENIIANISPVVQQQQPMHQTRTTLAVGQFQQHCSNPKFLFLEIWP